MPVLLAPEQTIDMHHPVFKMTITIRNENPDGVQVYPYVYIRVMFLNGIPTAEILPCGMRKDDILYTRLFCFDR